MQIISSAFADGGKIPLLYVMPDAGGQNVSVPLIWSGAPAGTQSFALAMVDPHPVARNWVHRLVVDLPQDSTSIPEGASIHKMPPGTQELKNSFGETGYGGPQPPGGSGDHPYVFTLYALSAPQVEAGKGAGLAAFKQALEGKILATATLTGYFGR
jgi:Raf kinase inhibitor-like YbhB/YbcL family protein